jgi:acetylglutamate kinase
MAVFERLIRNYFGDQGSPSKLETEVLDAIERLDGKVVQSGRNRGIRVYQDGKLGILRDYLGKPEAINKALLDLLLDHGYVPVLTVPIIDEQDNAIHTENDDVVRVLQKAMCASRRCETL